MKTSLWKSDRQTHRQRCEGWLMVEWLVVSKVDSTVVQMVAMLVAEMVDKKVGMMVVSLVEMIIILVGPPP